MDLAMMNRMMALLAQNESQNAPPVYQPLNIRDIIAQGAELPSCDPESKERLRRFLLLCLAVDYDLLESDKRAQGIPRKEWLMWVRLGKVLSTSIGYARVTGLGLHSRAWEDVEAIKRRCATADSRLPLEPALDKLEAFVDTHIVKPAFALGISPGKLQYFATVMLNDITTDTLRIDLAISMVRRYPFTLLFRGGHIPVWHRHQKRCMKALATKFFLDKEFLIDALIPPGDENLVEFREALHEKNVEVTKIYFVTLITPMTYSLTPWGKERRAWERTSHQSIDVDPLSSWGSQNPFRGGIYFGVLTRLFAALPEEGKARDNPGRLERWTRRKAKLCLLPVLLTIFVPFIRYHK